MKRRVLAFIKGVDTKWNANHIVQDLNLGHQYHFLRKWLLHKELHQLDVDQ